MVGFSAAPSFFIFLRKHSIWALPQQFPRRLMLTSNPCSAQNRCQPPLPYCTPDLNGSPPGCSGAQARSPSARHSRHTRSVICLTASVFIRPYIVCSSPPPVSQAHYQMPMKLGTYQSDLRVYTRLCTNV